MSQKCIDPIVGDILATWRYDISGIAPEMREAYDEHFAQCARCVSKQRLHRAIDIGLVVLASVSAVAFLAAFGIVRHYHPNHAFYLEIAGLAGFMLSALLWLAVLVATPAPLVITGAAKQGARILHDHLPEHVRDRVPERLRERIG
jgi:hypothetical protein